MQVYFAYLYLGSIVFFVYVFGYLLKSKKKKEEKKRLRRLSRSRRISSMTSYESSEDYSDETQVSRNASVSMENEYATSPVGRFIVTNTEGQRRRFSRTDSQIKEGSSKSYSQNQNSLQEKEQWASSSVKFNVADKTPCEKQDVVSYSLMNQRNDANSATSGRKSKKTKVSDNEHSHGSFFLRVGAVGRSCIII